MAASSSHVHAGATTSATALHHYAGLNYGDVGFERRRVLPYGHSKFQGSSNRARSLSGGTPNRCSKYPVYSPLVATLVLTMKEITPLKKDGPTDWGQIT